MIIKKASLDQYQHVREFYHTLIDGVMDAPYNAGWIKDVYPAPDFLMEAIRARELYIGIEDEKIIAAMVMNHQCNESYVEYEWPSQAGEDEIMVIHALGVLPSYGGRGYGKKMVSFAIESGKESGQKVIRLDVLKGNVWAEHLYLAMGFRYLHTLPMYYEDTGWTDYELFEYELI